MSARHKLLFFFNNPVSRTLHPLGYKSIFNLVNNARKYKTQWSIYGAPLSFHLNTLILLTLSLNYYVNINYSVFNPIALTNHSIS